MYITDVENKYLSTAIKHLMERTFKSLHCNIFDTQLIFRLPPFGKYEFLSSSHFPFEQRPKYEVYQYTK